MKICIRHRKDLQRIIHVADVDSHDHLPMRTAVRQAIERKISLASASLDHVCLPYSYLTGADLSCADLSYADLYSSSLTSANLAGADLAHASLGDASLVGASLTGADLRNADLTEANLTRADLTGADLAGACLRGARMTGVFIGKKDVDRIRADRPEVPVIDRLDARILQAIDREGYSLDMDKWHACQTTHCRAGFAVHLAGEAGYALERSHGPDSAGALIYLASTGRVPNFWTSNTDALGDLRRCAAKQTSTADAKRL